MSSIVITSSIVFPDLDGYFNHPVKGASAVFAVLFFLSAVLYIYQNSKYKSWHFTWLLPCASIIAAAGYVCNEYNAHHPQAFAPSQALFFSEVPVLTAALFLILGRLMVMQPNHSATLLTILWGISAFTISATISLTAQGAAGYLNQNKPNGSSKSGLALLKASLVLLLVCIVSFLAFLELFRRRLSAIEVDATQTKRIRFIVFALFTAATLILVRDIFRTVQLFSPQRASVWRTETFFWVFDAVPLLIATLATNAFHPGKLLLT